MTSLYEKNMKAFKNGWGLLELAEKEDSGFLAEVVQAKNGSATVRVQNAGGQWVFVHSSYNPAAEAVKSVAHCGDKSGLYVVFGFGLGYHVEELLKKIPAAARVFVVEPNPGCFREALHKRLLTAVLADKRVYWFFGQNVDSFRYYFDNVYDPLQSGTPEFLMPPVMEQLYKGFYDEMLKIMRDTISRKVVNVNTMFVLGAGPVVNTLRNLKPLMQHTGCAALFDKFKGKPAIIVAAGPSLDRNIHELARARGKAVIICVGTAMKALAKAKINADFVYSMDPSVENYEWHFKGTETGGAALVANLQTYPDIITDFPGDKFFTYYSTPTTLAFKDALGNIGQTWSGGSVANDCLAFAYLLGSDPIIMVGQDLSYTEDGKTHASGTKYEHDKAAEEEQNPNYLRVKANNGGTVRTARNWYSFLMWFERWIAERQDRKYINATEGGAYIAGTEVITLRQAIDRYCLATVDVQGIITDAKAQYQGIDKDTFINRLTVVKIRVGELKRIGERGLQALKKLEKACRSDKNPTEQVQLLKRMKKLYVEIEQNEVGGLVEGMVPESVSVVAARTFAAQRTQNTDSYMEAIADYSVYLHKIKEGCKNVTSVLDDLLHEPVTGGAKTCP